jgi:hypothetical protein
MTNKNQSEQMTDNEPFIAYCSLYCKACPAFTSGKYDGCKGNSAKSAALYQKCQVKPCCAENGFFTSVNRSKCIEMKKIYSTFIAFIFVFSLISCNKNTEDDDKNDFTTLIKVSGDIRNQIEYTITYPNWIKLSDPAVIKVKSEVKNGSTEAVQDYSFFNPTNGTISMNTIPSDNPNIRIREFVFIPSSKGEVKIYTDASIFYTAQGLCSDCPNYIIITVE